MKVAVLVAVLGTLGIAACSAPAPSAPATAPAAATAVRPAGTPTPRPQATPAPLGLVVTRLDEAALPPAEPTPEGFPAGRPTPTAAATVEAAWKYVTLALAVENRSDTARLAGISGSEPGTTNLAAATLTTPTGAKLRPFRSYTSFGLRTATGRTLTNYPVLLRLPSGYRAAAESFGALSSMAPIQTILIFKVPASLSDYGTLVVPPVGSLGPRIDDEVTKRLRPLIGTFQPLDLNGLQPGAREQAFPIAPGSPSAPPLGVGSVVPIPQKGAVTLASADVISPTDYQSRNRGWKQVVLTLRYRNDDPRQAQSFDVAAWFFGADGVVYSGDVPALGDFGRATTPPEPSAMLLWDGRSAGADQVKPAQEQEPRKLTFLVPNALQAGSLVLAGAVEASFRIDGLGIPAR